MLICFQRKTPKLAKFAPDADAIKKEHGVLQDLLSEPPVPGIVGPVEMLTMRPSGFQTTTEAGDSGGRLWN